jgi:hypothetical protein
VSGSEPIDQRVASRPSDGEGQAARFQAGEPPWKALAEEEDDDRRAMFDQMRHIGMASMQILHAGQAAKAAKILAEAHKALYRILAEEDSRPKK